MLPARRVKTMRTIYTPNEFEIIGNDCFIYLYDRNSVCINKAIIDKEDYPIVKNYKWSLGCSSVRSNLCRGKTINLSKLLVWGLGKRPKGLWIYHKDLDKLNNRRINLEVSKPIGRHFKGKPNATLVRGTDCFVIIDNKRHGTVYAIIDLNDYDLIKNYRWYMNPQGYAVTKLKRNKTLRMHSLILSNMGNNIDKKLADHINHNRLDNRRSNLRFVTHSVNSHNRGLAKNNTSGLIGVSWNKLIKKWVAQISKNKKTYPLGGFDSKEEAYEKYTEAAKKLYVDCANSILFD